MLGFFQIIELFAELVAEQERGKKGKWSMVTLIQSFKYVNDGRVVAGMIADQRLGRWMTIQMFVASVDVGSVQRTHVGGAECARSCDV